MNTSTARYGQNNFVAALKAEVQEDGRIGNVPWRCTENRDASTGS